MPTDPIFTKTLQSVMEDAGFLHKKADGVWDAMSQQAWMPFSAKYGATNTMQQTQPGKIEHLPETLAAIVKTKLGTATEHVVVKVDTDTDAVAAKEEATSLLSGAHLQEATLLDELSKEKVTKLESHVLLHEEPLANEQTTEPVEPTGE